MRVDAKVHRGNGDGLLEGDSREVAALEIKVEREVEVGAGVSAHGDDVDSNSVSGA